MPGVLASARACRVAEHNFFFWAVRSKGFPDENEYDSFLTSHGGSANAFTEMARPLSAGPTFC